MLKQKTVKKQTMVNWVRFEAVKLKQMTVDRNVADKMKRFLHTARRNSLLLLRQSTRLWSNHNKSNKAISTVSSTTIDWLQTSNFSYPVA